MDASVIRGAAAQQFSSPRHRTVRLSQPVPPPAFAARYGRGAPDPAPLQRLPLEGKARLLALTAASGSLDNVAALAERMEPPFWWRLPGWAGGGPDACAAAAAARARHMHVVRWLLGRGYPLDVPATLAAVMRHCDLADALWLLAQEPGRRVAARPHPPATHLPAEVVQAAAGSATPDAPAKLQWLFAQPAERPRRQAEHAAIGAAESDSLAALKWVLQQTGEDPTLSCGQLLPVAARAGAASVTAWLLGFGDQHLTAKALYLATLWAAEGGHTAVLQLLLPRALAHLPAGGDVTAFALRRTRCGWYLEHAARSGKLEAVQLVVQQVAAHADAAALLAEGLALASAAGSGGVAAARWLLGQRPQRPAYALTAALEGAASRADLAMMAFLRDEARAQWAPPDDMRCAALCGAARGGGALAALGWLEARGCPPAVGGRDTAHIEAACTDAGVLEWLHSRGLLRESTLTSPAAAEAAVAGGCEAVVEWLAAAGCPMGHDGRAYLAAARNADLDMLRCLKRLGAPVPSQTALQAMAAEGPGYCGWSVAEHVLMWMVEEGGASDR